MRRHKYSFNIWAMKCKEREEIMIINWHTSFKNQEWLIIHDNREKKKRRKKGEIVNIMETIDCCTHSTRKSLQFSGSDIILRIKGFILLKSPNPF